MSDNVGMMEQMRNPVGGGPPMADVSMHSRIVDVWDDNFFEEMDKIRALIPQYNHIAMDTEFPGIVEVPRKKTDDYQYQLVKVNVDELKMIQLGITLFDEEGNAPPGVCTWQFNFKYDVENDKSLKQSINVLNEAGLNFSKHKTNGIEHALFGEYFLTSGLVLNEDLTWICFQGNYDFGYMYRVLANTPLPDSEDGFLEHTKLYYPFLYDIKYMKEDFDVLKGGLSRMGEVLNLERFGHQHQAGSDSWLTGLSYFKLKDVYLFGKDIEEEYNNVLFGLGKSKNEEYYIEQYSSKTEQLEREAREYQNNDDPYFHTEQYHHYGYYPMSPNMIDYQNENMMYSHGNYGNPMMHAQQPMGYMQQPAHYEYGDNDYPMNVQYHNPHYQFQQMQGTRPDQNDGNMYETFNN